MTSQSLHGHFRRLPRGGLALTGYKGEKERMARVLIERVEKRFLPGLSRVIEVQEIGTPLTNIRFTRNHRGAICGAIYGWDQTGSNSGASRLQHEAPVENLFLTGTWTRSGHGYSAVIWNGIECFSEIAQEW